MQAIGILHSEHRSLAAVMHGMLYLIRDIRLRGTVPRLDVLSAMVNYIGTVTERFHHPKEDEYLFRLLAMRSSKAQQLIAQLQAEHRAGAAMAQTLERTLDCYRQEGVAQFPLFAGAATKYAKLQWRHIREEEDRVVPLARAYLTKEDWIEVNAAFSGHTDPLFGVDASLEYEGLFRRIVDLAPAPLGVGPDK